MIALLILALGVLSAAAFTGRSPQGLSGYAGYGYPYAGVYGAKASYTKALEGPLSATSRKTMRKAVKDAMKKAHKVYEKLEKFTEACTDELPVANYYGYGHALGYGHAYGYGLGYSRGYYGGYYGGLRGNYGYYGRRLEPIEELRTDKEDNKRSPALRKRLWRSLKVANKRSCGN